VKNSRIHESGRPGFQRGALRKADDRVDIRLAQRRVQAGFVGVAGPSRHVAESCPRFQFRRVLDVPLQHADISQCLVQAVLSREFVQLARNAFALLINRRDARVRAPQVVCAIVGQPGWDG